jgi:hypothetical protein
MDIKRAKSSIGVPVSVESFNAGVAGFSFLGQELTQWSALGSCHRRSALLKWHGGPGPTHEFRQSCLWS